MKICNKCKIEKLETSFYNDRAGLQSICKKCSILRSRIWALNNKRRVKKNHKDWSKYNKDKIKNSRLKRKNKIRESKLRWQIKNKEKRRLISRRYYRNNKDKVKAANDKWAKNNPGKILAKTRRYQLAKRNRIPKWADLNKIEQVYINRPRGKYVDHIIPLQGRLASGLHVHYNLQYLTPTQNSRKLAKFESITRYF